jgi:hypothetical protein
VPRFTRGGTSAVGRPPARAKEHVAQNASGGDLGQLAKANPYSSGAQAFNSVNQEFDKDTTYWSKAARTVANDPGANHKVPCPRCPSRRRCDRGCLRSHRYSAVFNPRVGVAMGAVGCSGAGPNGSANGCALRQSPGTHLEPQLSGGASEPPGRLNLALHLMNKHRMFL